MYGVFWYGWEFFEYLAGQDDVNFGAAVSLFGFFSFLVVVRAFADDH